MPVPDSGGMAIQHLRGNNSRDTTIALTRRPGRDPFHVLSHWVIEVQYAFEDQERLARLPLSDDTVAAEVEALLQMVGEGDTSAGRDLFVCLHAEWAKTGPVGRHPAWDAVLRLLAPLAVPPYSRG